MHTEQLHTVLFDRNGNTIVASTVSHYVARLERSSSRLGATVRNEMHLVLHNRQWVVVSRSGLPESPVYIQDRTVPDIGTGKAFIHQTLATYEQDTPWPTTSPATRLTNSPPAPTQKARTNHESDPLALRPRHKA